LVKSCAQLQLQLRIPMKFLLKMVNLPNISSRHKYIIWVPYIDGSLFFLFFGYREYRIAFRQRNQHLWSLHLLHIVVLELLQLYWSMCHFISKPWILKIIIDYLNFCCSLQMTSWISQHMLYLRISFYFMELTLSS